MNLLKRMCIIDSCPNCESAWTEKREQLSTRTNCIVCGNKQGEITGWVWGRLIDPFYWVGQWIVNRNLNQKEKSNQET